MEGSGSDRSLDTNLQPKQIQDEHVINAPQTKNALDISFVSTIKGGITTPIVRNLEYFKTSNAAPTTITDFVQAQEGQRIHILAADSNTTIANNANIVTNTGANKLLTSGLTYRFTYSQGVWHEDEGGTGAAGPPGPAGPSGATGPAGATGATGATGAAGSAGAAGATGAAGTPGSVWRDGTGAPSNALGIDGDYYLDDATGNVYLKSSGTYGIVANIKGATGTTGSTGSAGTPGSVWRDGSGVPSNALGVNGDYYLNDSNGDVYLKAAGTYSVVANIKGATGSTGSAGAPGSAGAAGSVWRDGAGVPSNALGVNGDYYLNDSNGDVYLKSGGTYSIVGNIKGATGSTGSTGTAGTNGSVWRDGSGVPSNALGVNGDYYLDDATGNVYLKSGGTYSIVANIKGAPGAGGSGSVGTATLDFTTGNNQASVAVTGQTGIVSGSVVRAWLQGDVTTDHSADEHIIEAMNIVCGSIIAGTGFTIYANLLNGFTTGQFTVHWQWS